MKTAIYSILVDYKTGGYLKKTVNLFLVILILANGIAVILETVRPIYTRHEKAFALFEIFSVAVFAIEYLARIWVCTLDKKFRAPIAGRIRYALTPLAVVDLMAILPFFLSAVLPADLRMLRILRLARLARLLKLAKYSDSINTIGNILRKKQEELVISACLVAILLLLSSSTLYYIERAKQPKAFSSIPATMWWGVATLTTVGYGDVYPVTPLGKFVGALVAILGVGMFALPAGILASGFNEYFDAKKNAEETHCPNCGAALPKNKRP